MKKLAFLMFLLAFLNANSQEPSIHSKNYFGIHSTQGILYFSDLSAINNVLVANNLPSLKTYIPVSNTGISFSLNRFLIQGNQRSYQLNEKDAGSYSLSSSGDGYDLKFGYDLVKGNKINLYPIIGIGDHNFTWIIDKKAPSSLDEALKTNMLQSNYLSIDNNNIGFVGILFDLHVFSFYPERIELLIGGDLEYLYSSGNGNWRLNKQITEVGEVNLSGFSWMINFTIRADISNKKQ
jgi:hypothetical protein